MNQLSAESSVTAPPKEDFIASKQTHGQTKVMESASTIEAETEAQDEGVEADTMTEALIEQLGESASV